MIANNSGTFSANVSLGLIVDDHRYELGHLGPDFGLHGEAQQITATEATLEVIVDGKRSLSRVRITSPITGDSRRFTFEAIR